MTSFGAVALSENCRLAQKSSTPRESCSTRTLLLVSLLANLTVEIDKTFALHAVPAITQRAHGESLTH
jgi:hypothetical protein